MRLAKELKKVLEFVAKKLSKKEMKKKKGKKGKKRARKTRASLAEYAKNKLLLDLQAKGSGGGGGYAPITANLDREGVKSDIMELKEKAKEQGRAVSGLEQYKQQLLLEQTQHQNPRQYMGEWLDFDEPEVRAIQNQVKLLEAEQGKLNAQLDIAVEDEDTDQLADIQQQKAEVGTQLVQEKKKLQTVKRMTRAKTKQEAADRLADEEYQNRMFLQELRGQKRPPGQPFEPAPLDLGDSFAAAKEVPDEAVLKEIAAVAAPSKIPKLRSKKAQ